MNRTAASNLEKLHEQRTLDAVARAETALRELNREGAQINFASVAKRAGVGRAFLYNNSDLRSEIEKLRVKTSGGSSSVPATERASVESLRARLRAALDENNRLRNEIQSMREELALAHGRARELETAKRTGRTAA